MTRRDMAWKAGGLALTASACVGCLALGESPLVVLLFPVALLGLPLMLHGKRVVQAVRAERKGHARTAEAVHAARVCGRRQNTDGFGL